MVRRAKAPLSASTWSLYFEPGKSSSSSIKAAFHSPSTMKRLPISACTAAGDSALRLVARFGRGVGGKAGERADQLVRLDFAAGARVLRD
jgi:hypothetical protein